MRVLEEYHEVLLLFLEGITQLLQLLQAFHLGTLETQRGVGAHCGGVVVLVCEGNLVKGRRLAGRGAAWGEFQLRLRGGALHETLQVAG